MRGFVLGTAALKLRSKEKAFRLLGKAEMVKNRNHHKLMTRDMERVDAPAAARSRDGVENPFAAAATWTKR